MAVPHELQAIADRLNAENARYEARVSALQREAYNAACELATRMGREDPTLRKVMLFGSTLPGRRYTDNSDIDLAVEGGDRALLERIASEITQSVDIIGLEELRPGILEWVLKEGVCLYEAKPKRY